MIDDITQVVFHFAMILPSAFSSAGTNLKVGAPVRSLPSTFLALKEQLVVLVRAFVMVSIQFGQFLVCCSSIRVSPVPSHL